MRSSNLGGGCEREEIYCSTGGGVGGYAGDGVVGDCVGDWLGGELCAGARSDAVGARLAEFCRLPEAGDGLPGASDGGPAAGETRQSNVADAGGAQYMGGRDPGAAAGDAVAGVPGAGPEESAAVFSGAEQ